MATSTSKTKKVVKAQNLMLDTLMYEQPLLTVFLPQTFKNSYSFTQEPPLQEFFISGISIQSVMQITICFTIYALFIIS